MPGIGRFVRRVPVVRALYTRMLAAWFGPQTIADVQSLNRLLVELDRRVADLENDWSGHVSRMKRQVEDGVTTLNHRLEREDGRLIAIEGAHGGPHGPRRARIARARRAYSDLSARFANLKAAAREGGAPAAGSSRVGGTGRGSLAAALPVLRHLRGSFPGLAGGDPRPVWLRCCRSPPRPSTG